MISYGITSSQLLNIVPDRTFIYFNIRVKWCVFDFLVYQETFE